MLGEVAQRLPLTHEAAPVDDNREAISPDLLDSRIMDSRVLDSHSNLMHKAEPSHLSSGPAIPAQAGSSMT